MENHCPKVHCQVDRSQCMKHFIIHCEKLDFYLLGERETIERFKQRGAMTPFAF